MKTLIRTVMLFCVVNLVAINVIFAQVASEAPSPDTPISKPRKEPPTLPTVSGTNTQRRLSDLVQSTRTFHLSSRYGGTGSVFVIPSAEITTEEIATITEDMNIMSRIFETNLEKAHIDVDGLFITSSSDPFHIAFARGKQSTQGMYLQGYGALFLMKVDFPLSPGPQAEEETKQTQKEEDADQVWAKTRQEMFAPEQTHKDSNERPKKEYDGRKVENLKTQLVQSLKHATNIRNLTSEESVILTVTGSGVPSQYKKVSKIPGRNEFVVVDRNDQTRIVKTGRIEDIDLFLPTVLVIRAKKSDIDRFAEGDLDFDQFQQNTQILSSAYMADQGGLGSPLTGYYYNYRTNQR